MDGTLERARAGRRPAPATARPRAVPPGAPPDAARAPSTAAGLAGTAPAVARPAVRAAAASPAPASQAGRPSPPRTAVPRSVPPAAGAAATPATPSAEAALLRIQAATLAHAQLASAGLACCGTLAELLGARRVTLGLWRDGSAEIVAVSAGSVSELQREGGRRIAAAMNEAVDQASAVSVPPLRAQRCISRDADALRRDHGGSVLTIPLMHEGVACAALTFEFAEPTLPAAPIVELAENAAALLGPTFALFARSEAPLRQRLRDAIAGLWSELRAPQRRTLRLCLGAAAAAVLALGVVPLPYSVGAPARVEGAVQRAVAAPANGYLKTVLVRPGDSVTAGQVIAELADRDLELERSKSSSEIAQHQNAHATAMAKADRAAMMIHGAKLAEAQAQLQLVEQQLGRTRLESPIDGVVIQGDLSQSLGVPVERGQVLMTIAPRESFRVIVELDERDITALSIGQTARLSLSALPWDSVPLRVVRLTPMATVLDGRNVFEVEAELLGAAPALRPGLRGVARIDVGRGPLLGVWTRRLTDHIVRALWRWLP